MAFWTPEHEQLLKSLWESGYTGGEIAQELNERVGAIPRLGGKREPKKINRDMVIAKARRMGLPRRESPLGQRPSDLAQAKR